MRLAVRPKRKGLDERRQSLRFHGSEVDREFHCQVKIRAEVKAVLQHVLLTGIVLLRL